MNNSEGNILIDGSEIVAENKFEFVYVRKVKLNYPRQCKHEFQATRHGQRGELKS